MNQDDRVAQLLDAAVPPIPPALRIPPYERIRRRAHRRRLVVAGSAVAVTVLLASVGAIATHHTRGLASTPIGNSPLEPSLRPVTAPAPPPALPNAPADAVSWQVVRVDRAGTRLMVYINPPSTQECLYYPTATASVDEGTTYVTITVTAKPAPVECSRVRAMPTLVDLSRPLLDRKVRDGRDGVLGTVVQDRDLPVVPLRWHEVPTEFSFLERGLNIGYTQPGGPDLIFLARESTDVPTGTPVRLGTRNGVLVEQPRVGVEWRVEDLVYSMQLEPAEGRTSTVDELHDILDQLTWP